jgi:hypothetical protein
MHQMLTGAPDARLQNLLTTRANPACSGAGARGEAAGLGDLAGAAGALAADAAWVGPDDAG